MSLATEIDGLWVELDTEDADPHVCRISRTVANVHLAGELAQVQQSHLLNGEGAILSLPPATIARIAAWAGEHGYRGGGALAC